MILVRCYRDGGAELFICVSEQEAKQFITEAEWLIRLNQMAISAGLPDITMFTVGEQVRPGVFEFK